MEKKYVYRKHLRNPLRYLMSALAFIIIVYIACAATFILTSQDMDRGISIIIFSIVGAGIVVFMGIEFTILYFVLFRRFKKISVLLTDEGVVYNNINGTTTIPYEEITALKFPSIKYAGGWIKIMYGKGNIKLTVVLENIGDFVKKLKDRLDNINFQYDKKKMYNFYKTAEFSDQSWGRLYDYIKYILLITALNVILSALLISLGLKTGAAFLLIISSIIMPLIVFVIAEIIVGRKLAFGASRENFSVPARDKRFESKAYKWAYGIYAVFYVIACIYLFMK